MSRMRYGGRTNEEMTVVMLFKINIGSKMMMGWRRWGTPNNKEKYLKHCSWLFFAFLAHIISLH